MKKRLILALLVLLAAVVALTGCNPNGSLGIDGDYYAKTETTPAQYLFKVNITDDCATMYLPTVAYTTQASLALITGDEMPDPAWMNGVTYRVAINGYAITFSNSGGSIPATLSQDRKSISFSYSGLGAVVCKKK